MSDPARRAPDPGGAAPGGAGGGLFGPLATSPAAAAAVADRAWVQAMLDAEAALARAGARAGVVDPEHARTISATCARALADGLVDVDAVGAAAVGPANPVPPLVAALTAAVPGDAAGAVHRGATSQDVLDTAAVLVARAGCDVVLADLDALADACATLADAHRDTVMAGRTLLQQALPTTFGAKAAGWLVGVLEAADGLRRVRDERLAAQLGGAAGTLASLGEAGPAVAEAFAAELGLREPVVPWHASRGRVAELAAALAVAAGAAGKVALDVVLLAQTEVAEVAEPAGAGRGGSSTLPHKRNPALSVAALASARRVAGLAGTLLGGMLQEHERAAGAWQAEWETLRDALALTAGTTSRVREVVAGLEVDRARMRAGLEATRGLLLAEAVSTALTDRLGRLAAHERVREASARAAATGGHLRHALLADDVVVAALGVDGVEAALDPARYLGATATLVDRALAAHRRHRGSDRGAGPAPVRSPS